MIYRRGEPVENNAQLVERDGADRARARAPAGDAGRGARAVRDQSLTPASSASAASRRIVAARGEVAERVARVAGQRPVGQAVGGAGGEDVLGRAAQRALRRCSCRVISRIARRQPERQQDRRRQQEREPAGERSPPARSAAPARGRAGRSARPLARRWPGSSRSRSRGASRSAFAVAGRRAARRPRPRRRCRTRHRCRRAVSRAVAETARPESWIPRPTVASSRIPSWTLTPTQANTISSEDDERGRRRAVRVGPVRRRGIEAHGAYVVPENEREGPGPPLSLSYPDRPASLDGCGYPPRRQPEPAPAHARAGLRRSGPRWSPRP